MDLTHALVHILPMTLSVSLVEYKDKPHCATASFSLLIYHCFVPVLCKGTFSKGYQGMVGQQMLPILRHFKLRNTKVCMSGKHFFVVDLRVQKSELFELIENVSYLRIMKFLLL